MKRKIYIDLTIVEAIRFFLQKKKPGKTKFLTFGKLLKIKRTKSLFKENPICHIKENIFLKSDDCLCRKEIYNNHKTFFKNERIIKIMKLFQ